MTSAKFDYFRFSIMPEHKCDNVPDEYGLTPFEHAMRTLRSTLLLGELIDKMTLKGRCAHYEQFLCYENISIKIPYEEEYSSQGILFEASSKGLDYFYMYLKSFGLTFKQWGGMLRALSFKGYKINIPRLDYAMDDITKTGEDSKISIKRIINAISDGELCCRARVWSDMGDDFKRLFSFRTNNKRIRGEYVSGITIQLGSRNSETLCRFYDKFAEQKQKGNELPEDCKAWTRCEFEYHDGNAISVFNAFLDKSPKEFGEYMCGCALNFVRFVERTSDNVSRCQNKRWWKEFLNSVTQSFRFEHIKPARSSASKFNRWFKTSVFPSLFTKIQAIGLDSVMQWFEDMSAEAFNTGRDLFRPELYNNLVDNNYYYEDIDGSKLWDYNSELPSDVLLENIKRDHVDYYQQFYKVKRLGQRPDPLEVAPRVL